MPLALLGFALFWAWTALAGGTHAPRPAAAHAPPLWPAPAAQPGPDAGHRPSAIGQLASWLGTLCWNEASQRLPTRLVGQLIVFETLAALGYAFALRGHWPDVLTATGIAVLRAGVLLALRVRP